MNESIKSLRAERDRMAALLLRLPALMAELDHLRLITGMLDAACAVTGPLAGAYVSADPADGGPLVTDGYSVRPQLAQAPHLAAVLGEGHVARVDDVTSWAPSETAARGYGVLSGGRLVRSLLAMPVRERGHRGASARWCSPTIALTCSVRPRSGCSEDCRISSGSGSGRPSCLPSDRG